MKRTIFFLLVTIALWACREKYVAAAGSSGKGLLVVEGNINIGNQATTTIMLSRVTALNETAKTVETGANVVVQAESGAVFNLSETVQGTYVSAPLNLSAGAKYRVQITLSTGKQYVSDYTTGIVSPPVDSISWRKNSVGGIQLFINGKLASNQSKYYQWRTEETWQFHSQYVTKYKWIYNVRNEISGIATLGGPDTSLFNCWKTVNSSTLLLANLDKYSGDTVHEQVAYIAPNSIQLTILYSINVIQTALTQDAYLFFDNMKKNTQQLGTVFDPQPSYVPGNIHAVGNPSEQVIGYISATQESSKRIFLRPTDVGGWPYTSSCEEVKVPNAIKELANTVGVLPILVLPDSITLVKDTCVDCRLLGVKTKPSFWP